MGLFFLLASLWGHGREARWPRVQRNQIVKRVRPHLTTLCKDRKGPKRTFKDLLEVTTKKHKIFKKSLDQLFNNSIE